MRKPGDKREPRHRHSGLHTSIADTLKPGERRRRSNNNDDDDNINLTAAV